MLIAKGLDALHRTQCGKAMPEIGDQLLQLLPPEQLLVAVVQVPEAVYLQCEIVKYGEEVRVEEGQDSQEESVHVRLWERFIIPALLCSVTKSRSSVSMACQNCMLDCCLQGQEAPEE